MSEGEHGSLQGMVVAPERLEHLKAIGITVGTGISRDAEGYFMDDGRRVELSVELTAQLLFRPS